MAREGGKYVVASNSLRVCCVLTVFCWSLRAEYTSAIYLCSVPSKTLAANKTTHKTQPALNYLTHPSLPNAHKSFWSENPSDLVNVNDSLLFSQFASVSFVDVNAGADAFAARTIDALLPYERVTPIEDTVLGVAHNIMASDSRFAATLRWSVMLCV